MLTKAFDILHKYISALVRSLPLLWKAAPRETVLMTVAVCLQGIIPVLNIWITKQVVDRVTETLTQGSEISSLTLASLVGAWIGALLLQVILRPWMSALQGNLSEKLTAEINLLLMRKADAFPDLSRFEDAKFYNELKLLQQQVSYQPMNFISNLAVGGSSLFILINTIGLLSPLGLWIPLLIIATTIPQIYVSFQYEKTIWEAMYGNSPQARQMEYFSSVMLTDTYAKEVRLFGLSSFLIGLYKKAFQSQYKIMCNMNSDDIIRKT